MGFSPKPHSSHSHMPLAEINVTPMVDVMLVLLIIFMVTAPMMISGVDVNLPESQAPALQAKDEKPLSVTVTKEGAIYLMEEQIDDADLLGKLQAFQKVRPKAPVMIRGDTDVQYGAVMKVIGAAGAAGFTNISLLSEAKKP